MFLWERPTLGFCLLVACCSSVSSRYLSFIWVKRWIFLLSIPNLQCLLVYTLLNRGQGTHLTICIPMKCLVEPCQWWPSSRDQLGCALAPTSGSLCKKAGSPGVLLLQPRSWPAEGDLLTRPFSYGKDDVKQEWLEVFQRAAGSDGTIWKLASKET